MTTTTATMHTSGKIGAAALLLAAGATGRSGFPQKLHTKPASVLASLSKAPAHTHALIALHKALGSTHASIVPKPITRNHALASAVKHPSPAHAIIQAVRQSGYTHANPSPAKHAPAAAKLASSATKPTSFAAKPGASTAKPAVTARELLMIKQPEALSPELAAVSRPPIHALAPAATLARAGMAPAMAMMPAAAAFSLAGTDDAEHALHITVGHLMFLNTKERVRRIYIANPAVLDSYTVSPNQIVLTAKAPGLSSVVVWDQTDQSQVYMVSSDINVDELRASMKQAMPNDSVQVEGRESRVVLSGTVGTDASSDAAAKLAGLFSKDVANSLVVNASRVRQVRLKVRIVEVDRSKLEQFGINIFGPGGTSVVGSGTTGQFPSTATYTAATSTTPASIAVSDPLSFFLYSFNHSIGTTIKDLENKQVLQILAEPTLTTISGQKASFLAGGEFPFPVVQGSAGGTATVTVQFRPYGVKLEFTPVVNIDGSVALKVMPEVSALDFTNAVTISGYTIPALSTKRADTQVVLRSGQSFAISGLLDRRTTDIFSKTPGIASVPVLGQLFKSKNVNLSTSELIVIVTPTVVDPLSEPAGPEEPARAEPVPVVPFMKPEAFDKSFPAAARKK